MDRINWWFVWAVLIYAFFSGLIDQLRINRARRFPKAIKSDHG